MGMVLNNPIAHVVIIVKKNHTFDDCFGTFPGVNGAALPAAQDPLKILLDDQSVCEARDFEFVSFAREPGEVLRGYVWVESVECARCSVGRYERLSYADAPGTSGVTREWTTGRATV
jgi:hypothetical protein